MVKNSCKIFYVTMFTCCLAMMLNACKQPQPQQAPVQQIVNAEKSVLPQPFRYHKLIESSPGKYFDVYSWGRGKDSSAEYLILYSDSVGNHYGTNYGDLDGPIIDVFNTDMNMDGNPEILIENKAKDTTDHIDFYAYEFKNGKGQKITFPRLSSSTKKTYRGGDELTIKEGYLVRQFPVYSSDSASAKPTGKNKILQYGLSGGVITVKDISPVDSSKITAAKPGAVVKPSDNKEKKKQSSSKKKKKEPVHHTTKKKKHHSK